MYFLPLVIFSCQFPFFTITCHILFTLHTFRSNYTYSFHLLYHLEPRTIVPIARFSAFTPKPPAIFPCYWPYFAWFHTLLAFYHFFVSIYFFLPLAIFPCHLHYFAITVTFPGVIKFVYPAACHIFLSPLIFDYHLPHFVHTLCSHSLTLAETMHILSICYITVSLRLLF